MIGYWLEGCGAISGNINNFLLFAISRPAFGFAASSSVGTGVLISSGKMVEQML
jgi:hypothetical protein